MTFWEEVQRELSKGVNLLKKGAGVLAEKTEETASLARLRYSLFGLRSEVSKRFAELGGRVYELSQKGGANPLGDAKVKELLEEVKEFEKQIKALEVDLKELKDQAK